GYVSQSKDHFVSFVPTPDNLTYAMIVRDGEYYEIAPKYHYSSYPKYKHALESFNHSLVGFKHSMIDWSEMKCGTTDSIHDMRENLQVIEAISPTDGNPP